MGDRGAGADRRGEVLGAVARPRQDLACARRANAKAVSGVGRKKAERLVLELQDKFGDVTLGSQAPRSAGAEEAVRALMGLGYGPSAADDAVRGALADGAPQETSQLIRRALQQLAAARGGR